MLQRALGGGPGNARVVDGTGTATGLVEGGFDTVMVRHVLFHLGAAAPVVVGHCASLLRPGGHLYLVDTDMEAVRICVADPDPDAVDLMRKYRGFQRGRGCDLAIGPRLGPLLLGAAAIPAMIAAGAATADDENRWRAGLRRLASTPGAAVFRPLFVAVGRRPG